jgi:membrane protein
VSTSGDIHHPGARGRRADYAPVGAGTGHGLFATVKRTVREFSEDNMSDWAAALTYYGLLSLFPALIALVSILGLFGDPQSTTRSLTDIVTRLGPSSAADTFEGPIRSITSNRGAAGVLFFAGLGAAIWSASGYVGAFTRAANVIYETPEGRPFWKLRPLQLLVTLAMVVLLALVALALVLTGPVVDTVADAIGIAPEHDLRGAGDRAPVGVRDAAVAMDERDLAHRADDRLGLRAWDSEDHGRAI